MGGDDRGKPRGFAIVWCLAVMAFAVLGIGGATTPTLAAAAKQSAGTVKPATAPAEKWEGFWAGSRRDCRNRDGFDSKTQIDLNSKENGQPAPLYDQYENHCRIDSHATRDKVTTLKLTCYEFWDDYRAKKNPRSDSIAVTVVDPQKITMNGKSFIRCKK